MLTKKNKQKNESQTCSPPVKVPNNLPVKKEPSSLSATQQTEQKKHTKTNVTVKHDIGFPNKLYIRGEGADLSWDKGQPLKNVKSDEWIWETDTTFSHCEFKVLINDRIYENGENHKLHQGTAFVYSPHFY